MTDAHAGDVRGEQGWPEREATLDRFEQAWQNGGQPRIEDFLSPAPPDDRARRQLLEELIKLDLEYRWRRGDQPRWEDYLKVYPILGAADQLSLDLIGYEYRVRRQWGDRPEHAEFSARFPRHDPALRAALARIDSELAAEFAPGARPPVQPPAATVAPNSAGRPTRITSGEFLAELRRCQLLPAEQLDQLAQDVRGRAVESRVLAGDLLKRGLLTPYQVNQLFQGRGPDLVLGSYRVLERLGEGGTGRVFKAQHLLLGRIVVLKVIRQELVADTEVVRRFYREIKAISQLAHPNIVQAFDAGPVGETHFLAMEFVEGTDLARRIKQSGPLPFTDACDCVRQAALGLQYIHERGLVHRDIKPSNLLLAQAAGSQPHGVGIVKLLDLGLARFQQPSTDGDTTSMLTPVGASTMGTPDYMAPEQALDFHAADIRADLYSLGCTLFHLLAGQPPFPGGSIAQKISRHLQSEPPALGQFRQDLPRGLETVVRRLLAKNAAHRYQTPAEAACALEPFAQAGGTRAWAVIRRQSLAVLRTLRSRRPSRRALLRAGLIGLPLLAGVGIWRSCSSPRTSLAFRSPLDGLKQSDIPARERFAWQPEELVAVLGTHRFRHWGGVYAVAFTPDGRQLVTGGGDMTIRLWNVSTGYENVSFRTPSPRSVAVSPNGQWLACPADMKVLVLDAANGVQRAIFEGHKGHVTSVAFSADSRYVASGSVDRTVRLWEISTGKGTVLDGHSLAVRAVGFAASRPLLASASDDTTVRLWDGNTGKPWKVPELKGHTQAVTCVALARDGTVVASGSSDKTVRLWDVETGTSQREGDEYHTGVSSVALSADGQALAAGHIDGAVRLWNLTTGKRQRATHARGTGDVCVTFAPNSQTVAAGSTVGRVRLWSWGKDKDMLEEVEPLPGYHGMIRSVEVASDSMAIAIWGESEEAQLWKPTPGKDAVTMRHRFGIVQDVAFFADGRTAATAGADAAVRFWDVATGQPLLPLLQLPNTGAAGGVAQLALARDGQRIATGKVDGYTQIWDGGRDQPWKLNQSFSGDTRSRLLITPDGQLVFSGTIQYDVAEGKVRSPLPGRAFALSADGKTAVLVADDRSVRLWDVASGRERAVLKGHTDNSCLALAPDGRTLATGGQDGSIRLWNAVTGEGGTPLAKEAGPILCVALAPQGDRLAASGRAGQVILLRTDSAANPSRWQLPGPVPQVLFAPDGRHLVTVNGNGTAYILRPGTR